MEYTTDESSIVEALSALQKNNTQLVSEATNFLLQAMESQYNLETFFSILCSQYPPYERQVCSILARQMLIKHYKNIDVLSRMKIKQISLSLLSTETNHGIRRAICGMISVIAMYEYMGGEWTEVKDIVFSGLQNEDSNIRESVQLLLFALGSFSYRIFSQQELSHAIMIGLADKSYDVLFMTIKAFCKIVIHLYVENQAHTLAECTQFCIDHLQEWYEKGYTELFLTFLQTFMEVIKHLSKNQLTSLSLLSIQIASNQKEMDSIRTCCLSFLTKVISRSWYTLEKDYSEPLFVMIFNCMNECTDLEGNEELDGPCCSAEALLDAVGSSFENK